MSNFPKIRFPAVWVVVTMLIVAAGNGGDIRATIENVGTQAAAGAAMLMALAKVAEELGRSLAARDQAVRVEDCHIVSYESLAPLWRRVL